MYSEDTKGAFFKSSDSEDSDSARFIMALYTCHVTNSTFWVFLVHTAHEKMMKRTLHVKKNNNRRNKRREDVEVDE